MADDNTGSARLGSNYWRLWTSSLISNLGDGVGLIAYPWLASALTRSPLLLAIITLTGTLPWLLFSLPSGVIIDRLDRRRLVVAMDMIRGALTMVGVLGIVIWGANLPDPQELEGGLDIPTNWPLYLVFVVSSFLLGCAQVLRDNAATTLLPSIVKKEQLEKANGQMWSAELVANSLAGPALGSALIGVSFILPIMLDASTFFVAAGLMMLIPGTFTSKAVQARLEVPNDWKHELREAFMWLRRHPLLWPMAMILAALNLIGSLGTSSLILFAQEVLETSPLEFAILTTGGAVGGIIGGLAASRLSQRFGAGTLVQTLLFSMPLISATTGLAPNWFVAWIAFMVSMFLAIIWNTLTVSLRQSIIPDHLLGRVNSAYRFLVLGSMPIGVALGGLLVSALEGWNREWALRMPWLAAAVFGMVLAVVGYRYLSNAKIQAARDAAALDPSTPAGQ